MNRGTLSMIAETGTAWYVGDCWGEMGGGGGRGYLGPKRVSIGMPMKLVNLIFDSI